MAFQIHYEVAAVSFLLAMLSVFWQQKHLKSSRNSSFQFMLITAVLVCCFDVLKAAAASMQVSVVWKQVATVVYLVSSLTFCLSYMTYVLAVIRKLNVMLRHMAEALIPYILGILLCVTTPWTGWIVYFDHGVYNRGILYPVFFLIFMLYVLAPLFLAVTRAYQMRKRERLWIFGVPIVTLLSVLVQYFLLPDVLLVQAVGCLVVFLCFLFLQNSDYYLDEITGFFKMHGFESVARERMDYGRPSSILVIRIMNYTALTEMYEDFRLMEIQSEIAKFMKKECGKKDYYHIAASTFAVISPTRQESEEIYQILRDRLPKTWYFEGEEYVHEYTYYIVETPEECNDVEELFQRIGYARSDHVGHHKPGELIRLTHDAVELSQEKQRVADLIEKTILDNSIDIYFQPIFSMEKKRVTSLEVLARLKDENKKFINPEFFIHVAEENRTIIPLGEQIYRKACIFAKENRIFDMGIDDININLSPVQCCYEELADNLIQIAGEYGIPMSRMHLEITESGIMDKKEIMDTLGTLRSSGAKIALDDFGTGYSSMTSIINLPVDFVKIDKSLVWSYGRGENQYLDQLVPMIHSEGKRIISEGIETQEHIDIFKRLDGDFLQGYFYSKPLPEKEFIQYLQEANQVGVV